MQRQKGPIVCVAGIERGSPLLCSPGLTAQRVSGDLVSRQVDGITAGRTRSQVVQDVLEHLGLGQVKGRVKNTKHSKAEQGCPR